MTTAEMLAALDDVERRVVRLVYFDGLSTVETARRLGLDRRVVAHALGSALRRVAGFVLDEVDPPVALAG